MNNLNSDILRFEVLKYLDIKDKLELSLVNKKFSKVTNINYHIGTFISHYLGLDPSDEYLLEILKENKFEFLQDISDFLLNENKKINKCKPNNYFSMGTILRLKSKNYNECIDIIKNGMSYSIPRKKYIGKTFNKYFQNVNSLLLC